MLFVFGDTGELTAIQKFRHNRFFFQKLTSNHGTLAKFLNCGELSFLLLSIVWTVLRRAVNFYIIIECKTFFEE